MLETFIVERMMYLYNYYKLLYFQKNNKFEWTDMMKIVKIKINKNMKIISQL